MTLRSIRRAKIFHERGTLRYPNKLKWHYFTVVRGTGLPIKISASSAEELAPVYEGIVGFLDREARMKKMRMEQNRERTHMQGMYRETYYWSWGDMSMWNVEVYSCTRTLGCLEEYDMHVSICHFQCSLPGYGDRLTFYLLKWETNTGLIIVWVIETIRIH